MLVFFKRVGNYGLAHEPLYFVLDLLPRSQFLAGLLDLIDRDLDTGVRVMANVDILEGLERKSKSFGHVLPLHLLSSCIEHGFHLQVRGAIVIILKQEFVLLTRNSMHCVVTSSLKLFLQLYDCFVFEGDFFP